MRMLQMNGASSENRFRGPVPEPRYREPTSASSEKYYASDEEWVEVKGRGRLHILKERKKFKLVLYGTKGDSATKLKDLGLSQMKEALETGLLVTDVGSLRVSDLSPIKRLLSTLEKTKKRR